MKHKPLVTTPAGLPLLVFLANPRNNANSIFFAVVVSWILLGMNQNGDSISQSVLYLVTLCLAAILVSTWLRKDPAAGLSRRYVRLSVFADSLQLLPDGRMVPFAEIENIEHGYQRRPGSWVELNTVVVRWKSNEYVLRWTTHPIFGSKNLYGWDFGEKLKEAGLAVEGEGSIGKLYQYGKAKRNKRGL